MSNEDADRNLGNYTEVRHEQSSLATAANVRTERPLL